MKRTLFILSAVVISIWAALTLTSNRRAASSNAVDRSGAVVEIAAVAGAPMTIVHFWGTWCGPCRDELPEFAAFRSSYAGKGVGFVTVADDPDFATVDQFLQGANIDIGPVLLDSSGAAAREWKVDAYPTTFVIGPGNEILAKYRGMIDWTSPLQRREILRLGGLEP